MKSGALTDEYHRLLSAGLEVSLLIPNLRGEREACKWYVYFALRSHFISPGKAFAFADRIRNLHSDAGLVAEAIQDNTGLSAARLEDIRGETGLADSRIHMALLELQRWDLLEIDRETWPPGYAIKAPQRG